MKAFAVSLLVFLLSLGTAAGEFRTWTAADGSSTIEASLVRVDGDKVELVRKDGREIKVPIAKLCEADREYLASQLQDDDNGAGNSTVESPKLPYKVGVVSGPVEAASDAHYYYYVPKSLKPGRKAPLLFYTNSGGDSAHLKHLLNDIAEGAEICQWVLAISVESRNSNPIESNKQSSKNAVKHILRTLPAEEKRVYFTGNSGGAAMAFYNYDQLDGFGVMSSIGYVPLEVSVPNCDCFFINGAWDYNRYASAYARSEIGRTAIQRFHDGGHRDAPGWIMIEGMVWLEGRYLAEKGKKTPAVQQDYEKAVLDWIESLGKKEPHRAYYWAQFLQKELKLSKGSASAVAGVVRVLGADRLNRLYVEGLEEIDEFAVKKLSGFGQGSRHNHTDPQITSECEDLLKKYTGVPVIEELLKAFCKPTQE